jgi:hypothetical protein
MKSNQDILKNYYESLNQGQCNQKCTNGKNEQMKQLENGKEI